MAADNRSKHYEKVKDYYEENYWSLSMVKNAVRKGWITEEEYKTITGEEWGDKS